MKIIKMKKILIIGAAAIILAASSVAVGYFLAEKYIGPPSAGENTVVTPYEKAKIEQQKQEREEQILNEGMKEIEGK